MAGFKEGMRKYQEEGHSKHGTLVIKDAVYLGYEGYGINKAKISKIGKT